MMTMPLFSTLYGLMTAVLIVAFLCLCAWVYQPRRRQIYQTYGTIPLQLSEVIPADKEINP